MSEMHAHSHQDTKPADARDVRAGPGDAGRADRPEPLPKSDQYRRRTRSVVPFTAGVILLGLLAILVFALI